MKTLIIDYLEGRLNPDQEKLVAEKIESIEEWAREYEQMKLLFQVIDQDKELEPDTSLKVEFETFLKSEIEKELANDQKVIDWRPGKLWMQIAAGVAILVVGVLLGKIITENGNDDELLVLRKEMQATKELVMTSLQNQSASTRLNAMNVSYNMATLDDEMTAILIKTMNSDPNTNVRLAAVDALSKFSDKENVMFALIQSLTTQDKPMVQIALINLMVQLKEKKAVQPLMEIIDDNTASEEVKEEANYGVFKLS